MAVVVVEAAAVVVVVLFRLNSNPFNKIGSVVSAVCVADGVLETVADDNDDDDLTDGDVVEVVVVDEDSSSSVGNFAVDSSVSLSIYCAELLRWTILSIQLH